MKLEIQKRTNIKKGLSNEQAKHEKSNHIEEDQGRTYKQIIKDNVLTLFNVINVILAILVLITGSYRNMAFTGLVVVNTVIGIFQEFRSKKELDALKLLNQNQCLVIRDGQEVKIPVDEIVRNDIMLLSTGDQLSVDAIIVDGQVEADESILTGESDAIEKGYNDELLSR